MAVPTLSFTTCLPNVRTPQYSSDEAAGLDFYNHSDDYLLKPSEIKIFRTGIRTKIPLGYFLLLQTRSSMAIEGIQVVGGVIDSDYLGEITIVLHNKSIYNYFVQKNIKIAQGILLRCKQAQLKFYEEKEFDSTFSTRRGMGGFGSTNDSYLCQRYFN